jgi:hypothetical protein
VAVGYLQHPLQKGRPVAIPFEQFTKHFVLTGMTGSGKSSTAVMMKQSLLDQWTANPDKAPGFSYFDPARETVATILTRLLKAELDGAKIPWEKIHYAYLGPTEYPLGLNLLHHEQGEAIDAVAKEVLGILKHAYTGDTPRMDRLVENALLTLLEDRRQHTILGIVPILTDENFRNRILPQLRDPIVRQFWERDVDNAAIDPILNRLSPLLTNKTMRRMFGQRKWSLNLRQYMDEGHIFLWDLLNVSKENVKLAVGHIITQYHQTAKTRSSGAKPHILAVDEAHLVQIPVMTKIIAEDRKFGLCLGLITQYIGQFQPWLIDAITENVGTILTCTQGMKSAGAVSTMTAGAFDKGNSCKGCRNGSWQSIQRPRTMWGAVKSRRLRSSRIRRTCTSRTGRLPITRTRTRSGWRSGGHWRRVWNCNAGTAPRRKWWTGRLKRILAAGR